MSCLGAWTHTESFCQTLKQFSLDRGCTWVPETGDWLESSWMKVMLSWCMQLWFSPQNLPSSQVEESKGNCWLEKSWNEETETYSPPGMSFVPPCCLHTALCNVKSCQTCIIAGLLFPATARCRKQQKWFLMLGAMKDIVKEQSTQSSGGPTGDTEKGLNSQVKMPVIFLRV